MAPPFGFEPPTVPSAGGLFPPLRTVARQLGSGVWDCQNGSRAHLPGGEPATGTAARVSLRAADSDAMRFDRQHPAPEPESAHDLADLTSVVVMVKPI